MSIHSRKTIYLKMIRVNVISRMDISVEILKSYWHLLIWLVHILTYCLLKSLIRRIRMSNSSGELVEPLMSIKHFWCGTFMMNLRKCMILSLLNHIWIRCLKKTHKYKDSKLINSFYINIMIWISLSIS